ncbi:stage II sporulation protein R [Robertmurraya korlensis]|uniref:stage II sporulation protein R n=1 Tax=Robertmurraya korlensis TaxID=519977 RepID=UPI00203CD917|nr:stage II sporulation protein R [Robertmurraya korlensis]MCM3602086.1 stage II sporulation protein R [Robertmurraya korlensis]
MKTKTLAKLYIIILSIGTLLSLYIPKNEVTANDAIVIPNEAIRLRILANSDLEVDQELKREVRDEVNAAITEWVAELTSVEAARDLIQSRLPEIKAIAEEVLEKNGSNQSVKTDFGKVEFPTKLYGEFLYPAGEYEAVLITLGAGEGANWWCVLFPPLCFLDFSNSVAVKEGVDEQEEKEAKVEEEKVKVQVQSDKEPVFVEEKRDEQEVEVKFFLVELWDKIFS